MLNIHFTCLHMCIFPNVCMHLYPSLLSHSLSLSLSLFLSLFLSLSYIYIYIYTSSSLYPSLTLFIPHSYSTYIHVHICSKTLSRYF